MSLPETTGFRPDGRWPRTTPQAAGLSEEPLAALDADFAGGRLPLIDAFLVVRGGAIAFERTYEHDYGAIYANEARRRGPLNPHLTGAYNCFDPHWHPYHHGTRAHSMQSITKSVTATIIGIAIEQGDFRAPLDTPVLAYFDATRVQHLDERKRRMTLRHVLTMTTGLEWDESLPYNDPRNPTASMEASRDWVQYVIDLPMAGEPGAAFAYSSGATQLLAHVFERVAGQDIETYARRRLFGPLGIHEYHWKRTPLGVVDTEGGLFLTAGDLARIGQLHLHRGRWQDRQLVAAEFLTDALSPQADAGKGWKYGYQWWLYPQGPQPVWAARGFGGQQLLVFPEEDLIVVTTAWDILAQTPLLEPVLARIRESVAHPPIVTANVQRSKEARYRQLTAQLAALLTGERNGLANSANMAALLHQTLPSLNWVGFYFLQGGALVLGPFQGRVACTRIAVGRGVCGAAAERRETVIVPDVHDFPGHIACDAASRSEIVVPLLQDGRLLGVLDLDSPQVARFDQEDADGLHAAVDVLLQGSELGRYAD
jgi:putative methionine-R-sulfoxide reductase with GAF domain/CubicO group peptidase (beta-lactamase class C family)